VKKIIDEEFGGLQAQKADVVEDLHEKKFRPFPKLAKAKSAGETEDAEDGANDDVEEAATGTSTDYDHLLGLAVWSFMKEKVRCLHEFRLYDSVPIGGPRPSLFLDPQIEKILQQAADKEKELLALPELTLIQIWNTDLDRFLEEWEVGLHQTDPLGPVS
jgi:DNA topoisomerase-2